MLYLMPKIANLKSQIIMLHQSNHFTYTMHPIISFIYIKASTFEKQLI